jgi:kynureninase
MAPLRASLEIFDEAGMSALREKSIALTGYLEFLLDSRHSQQFSIITPRDPAQRGAQLSLSIPRRGRAVQERLAEEGVLCDFREPDVMRVAAMPLYCTYRDVHRFVERFSAALG